VVAWAQQPALPVVGFINPGSVYTSARNLAAFRAGLSETGYVEGQNVLIEYDWLEGQVDRLPALMADLVRRRVAVIATPGNTEVTLAAKSATATIPIVFAVGANPVGLGLVASLARPGGNLTGMNTFTSEAVPNRLGLLREMVPKAVRAAVLVNPNNSAGAESTLRQVQDAARLIGLPIDILKASTGREIEEAFATMVRDRAEALFIDGDSFFASRFAQFVTLAARHGIATSYPNRAFPQAGGLMSYGTDFAEAFHQVGSYTGRILKGAKPADLPVVQSVKFEFAINMQTARALGLTIPETLLAIADEVIQ
jgi:putative ABC transport system substrate-binding protein